MVTLTPAQLEALLSIAAEGGRVIRGRHEWMHDGRVNRVSFTALKSLMRAGLVEKTTDTEPTNGVYLQTYSLTPAGVRRLG